MTNKYEDIGRQMVADEDRARASIVEFTANTTPEQEVEIRTLAQRTGAPAEAVRADPDGARKAAERARIAALSPTTQRWLTENPDRYALVKDDVGSLDKLGLAISRTFEISRDNGLSAGWRTMSDHLARWDNIGRGGEAGHSATPDPLYVEEVVTATMAGYQRALGNAAMSVMPDLGDADSRARREAVAQGLGFTSDSDYQASRAGAFVAAQERRAQGIERTSAATDAQFQNIAAANEADSLWEALGLVAQSPRAVGVVVGQSLGMGASGLALTAATGGMGRLATMGAAGGASGMVEYGAAISESLSEAGIDLADGHAVARALRNPAVMAAARERATKRGVTIGLFDAATAGLAGQLLINARRGATSAALRTAGEVGIQAGGGAAGELAAQLVAGDDVKMGDIILEGIAELPFGAVEARANYVTARERGQVRWINEQLDIVRRSSSSAESLQASTAAAAEAKLGQRSPDDARAFAQAAGAEGAIYIDADVARTLFQSDWQLLVDAVGGDAALTEQLAAGDVAIPADQYFSRIAQLPYAADIARNARTQADALSAVELESYDIDALADEMAGDTADAAERATPGEPTTRQRVQDDVYGQLIATDRFTDAAAQAQAKLWGAFFASMESRYGADGWAAYQRYMRGINTARADGRADPRSTRPWQGDGQLDALLDSIRNGQEPDQAAMRGPSLSAFVQRLGGISDDTGELRGMDAGRQRIGLLNAQGVPLDRAREAAAEAGYLPADSDVNALLDLLDRDLRDGDVFSEQFADQRRVAFSEERARLEAAIAEHDYLRSLSPDEFGALTNQQIVDALFGQTMDQAEPGSFDNPLPESEMESAPVGAWVAGPALPGLDTRRQIMDVPLDRIDPTEFDSAGQLVADKRAYAERYAEAMRAGDQFPNGRGSELPSGMIKLQDGHRRFAAARAVGAESMRLAVSPLSLAQAANFDQPASDFESRFGDSKVVDDQGRPLLVYHGTSRDFTEFRMGSAPGWGRGIYFTDNRDQAEADYGGGAGGRVVEAYLSIRNPWRGGFPGYEEVEGTQAWQAYTGSFEDSLDAWNEDGGFAGEVLRELGYDGVIAENSNDIRGLEIVAFDAAQIIPAAERDAQQQFDESSFRPAVVSWAQERFGDLVAPNGRPAWQNFVAWFGESQAVDSAGAPVVVHHGSPDARFMDADATFMSMQDRFGAQQGVGAFWFAESRRTASTYADDRRAFDYQNAEARIIPAFLSLQNPLIIDAKGQKWGDAQRRGATTTVIDEAIANGHDGVIIRNVRDDYVNLDSAPTTTFTVFNSRQIKSADANAGNFSPELASILEQPAYHGTPHDVDRFSLQKIGTGEGAQVYGWGLYFASQREVADFYRRNLTGIARNIPATMGDKALQEAGGDRGRAVAALTRRRDALPEAARGNTQAAIDWLRRGQDTGRLYQVDVPEDSDLLDWDKPYSEQPQKVRDALPVRIEKDPDGASDSKWVLFVGEREVDGGRTRKELQEKIDSQGFGEIVMRGMGVFMGPKQTSEYLLAQGIPGLRYLDGASRGSGGTHNYVIWDESAVSEPVRLNQSAVQDPTATPEFRRWFGDSKVVDAQGRPLVVYHGGSEALTTIMDSAERMTAFDESLKGSSVPQRYIDEERAALEPVAGAMWFTDDEYVADGYSGQRVDSGVVTPVYLSIQNPLDFTQLDRSEVADLLTKIHGRPVDVGDSYSYDKDVAHAIVRNNGPVVQWARDNGYDGLIYPDTDVTGRGTHTSYVTLSPGQIKSATGNTGAFDPSNPNILFQPAINAPTFYSAALAAIESGRGAPKRGDAQAWKGWLDGAQRRGEMRQSERDWLGIDAWLDAQEGPVTREALAEFVRANQVQIEEVVLGAGNAEVVAAFQERGYRIEYGPDQADFIDPDGEYVGYDDLPGDLQRVLDNDNFPAKFESYQLPGGENYRELLLTLPAANDGLPPGFKVEQRNGSWGVVYPSGIFLHGFSTREDAANSQARQSGSAAYRSSHWDVPNVLAHVRFNERTDADGKRVLFIEEIQSDWHQDGRKRGYSGSLPWVVHDPDTNTALSRHATQADADAALDEARANGGHRRLTTRRESRTDGVPDAPFKATDEWAMLAFKRMVRHAAENGFDRIAWTPGDMQAQRYDLSTQVNAVAARPLNDGSFEITIVDRRGNEGMAGNKSWTADELPDLVGKELADKIIADTANGRSKRYSGLDLAVGGAGMRAFYDKILPSAVNKWAKKLGGRVGSTAIPAPVPGFPSFTKDRTQNAHAIDITPAMREAAAQGMTLFQAAQTDTPEFRAWSGGAEVLPMSEASSYAGGPVVFELVHGTTADFDVFDPEKANPESDMGAGFYFTNNPDDVAENYAGLGPDLASKIEREAERIAAEEDADYDDPGVVARARARWMQHDGASMPVYVRLRNPAVVGGPHETFLGMEESYNEDADEYGDPEGLLVDAIEAIRVVADEFMDVDADTLVGELFERGADGGGLGMAEFIESVRNSEAAAYATDPDSGDAVVGEFVRRVLAEVGFDGIVDLTVDMKFGSQRQSGKSMAGMDEETVHVIAFESTQIKSRSGNSGAFDPNNPSILGQTGGESAPPRGQIQIYPDQSMMISLFEKADRSTFLHETGHFFLEVLRDMAAAPDAPAQVQADMAALLAWFGVESADQIAVEHHEQFARGFEKYLGEGRAPSPELQSAFSQFKAWLLSVYRALASLNVTLTDDVRGVMDRMLAAEEEIEAAQVRQGMEPVTFGEGVLEDAELARYAELVTSATEEARAEVTARLMAAHDRAAKRWYKEQKAEVRREVEGEYASLPVYRAARALAGARTFADGTEIPDAIRGLKLDKAALVSVYGDAYLKRLRGLYAVEGGVDQDVAAMRLGFESGDALVTALANREDMAARVDAETDARMRERHGDPMTDGTLAERAMDAAHNDHRMRVLAWEMAVLEALASDPAAVPDIPRPQREGQDGAQEARQPRQLSPEARARVKEAAARRTASTRALTEAARRAIGKKTLRDIRPHDYLVAERKAARKAATASAGGRYVDALQAKRQQAFNAALYREAKRLQARADANVRFLRKAASEKTRLRVGQQAGKFYVEALDAIFDGIEVRGASRPAVARRAALREWVARMQEDGNSTAVPEILLARVESERVTNLADMTADDVEGLREAVANILHLAKTKNRLLTARGAREWEDAKEAMLAKLQEQPDRHGRHGISDADRAMLERVTDLYAAGSNWVLQPETLIEWLDGGTEGPFHDLLWDQAQASERKREALNRMVGTKLQEALDALPATDRKALDRRFRIESLGGEVSGHSILSALLNMGNEGNRDKLLRGGRVVGDEIVPFTPHQLADMFAKLTRPQAELVQKVWDAIDQLWPEIVALEESMNGMSPERVEASQFTVITRDGPVALRGGYYPAMYDPKGARIGQFSEDEQAKRVLAGQTPIRASTSKGHTEKRTEFAAPMLLDYHAVLSRHLDGVIGDIAYRQFLRQVYKVLGDADVRRMVDNRVGPGATVGLRKSFERGATGNFSLAGPLLGPFQKVADATMTNLSSAALGFRIPLALANVVAAPIQAGARVKPRYVLSGLRDYYLSGGPNVVANMRRNTEAVHRLSPLMLRRSEARSVELGAVIANLRGQRGFRAKMIEMAMSVHQWTVPLAENAVWMGAYQQAQADGMDMADAVNAADKAIRQTQTKTSAMELSQAEGGYLRMFMMFAGPLVIMNNRMQEAGLRGLRGDVKSWPQALAVWFAVAMGAAWSFELIMGRGAEGDDGEEPDVGDWTWWAAKKLLLLPFSAFPVIREAASYVDSGFMRGNPVSEAMKSVVDTYGALADSVFGDEDVDPEKIIKQSVRAAGAATGVPSNQLLRTGDYLMSVGTGEHEFGNPAAEAYYLVQGAPADE